MADSFVSKEYLQKQFQNYSTVVKDNFEKKGAVTAETLKYTNVNKPIVDTVKNALDLLFQEGGGGGDSSVTLTQEEYEALTEEQKLNGLIFMIQREYIKMAYSMERQSQFRLQWLNMKLLKKLVLLMNSKSI